MNCHFDERRNPLQAIIYCRISLTLFEMTFLFKELECENCHCEEQSDAYLFSSLPQRHVFSKKGWALPNPFYFLLF